MSIINKNAILIAGMHRSGTSALTRVISFLGADLPTNLVPALPENNETGFWESVDLLIQHDKLLHSAGSSWSDWTEFNVDWYDSVVGRKYHQVISDIVKNNFSASNFFVVKDPRICRILPFWLNIIQQQKIQPFVIIPIRNPLEVAQSLKARDGFPLAKGGLIWLRHVLDAVFFSQGHPVAFVAYEKLMQDWKSVIDSITSQCGLRFPRISVQSALEIEQYIDQKQKHNSFHLDSVHLCRDFSPLISDVYALLSQLVRNEERSSVISKLLEIRKQFNENSLIFAKAINSSESFYIQELVSSQSRYESQIQRQEESFRLQLQQKEESLKSKEESLKSKEESLKSKEDHFKLQFQQQEVAYKLSQQQQAKNLESALEEQKLRLSIQLDDCYAHLNVARIEQQNLLISYQSVCRELSRLRFRLVSTLEGRENLLVHMDDTENNQLSDVSSAPSRLKLRKEGKLLRLLSDSGLFDQGFYKKSYPDLVKVRYPLIQHYLFSGGILGLDPHILFDSQLYFKLYPDVKKSKKNPLVHYLLDDVGRQQPHILFDASWYLNQYPDVADSRANPLVHYIRHGWKELRNPHPLFLVDDYISQYQDVKLLDMNPLVHYLSYGSDLGCSPHPLFDSSYYLRQIGGDLPRRASSLGYYLSNKQQWAISPSSAFDGAWYLEQYPDVYDSKVNPLLHYVLYGCKEGRKPHPQSHTLAYQKKHASLFVRAGLKLVDLPFSTEGVVVATSEPEGIGRLRPMVGFLESPLQPDNNSFKQDKLVIHWVTCDFAHQGAGGHMTIFRFIRLFELLGYQQHIWLHNQFVHDTVEGAYEDLVRHYQQTSVVMHFVDGSLSQASGDVIIATDWESVWPVLSVSRFKRRFYFVQDHEPSFFPVGSLSRAAESTYLQDVDCICAGPWLEQLMQEKYSRWATKFWLAADQSIYYPFSQKISYDHSPRIAFYARTSTSRRAVELGLLALDYLAQMDVDFYVDLYGSTDNTAYLKQVKFKYTDHGVLSPSQLGMLYRECDIGIVFSATNYSLVPQEMMACGLAVVELDGDNTRAVFPEGTVALVAPHPREIAKIIKDLLVDRDKRLAIAGAGCNWARQFDWESTVSSVNMAIQQRLEDLGYVRDVCIENQVKVSVVIPVLNGGDLLCRVVDAVSCQKTPWRFDLLVIDSGSVDGSLEAMQLRGVRVHSIPKSEFSHGGTRNLGVSLTQGEYVAFLTQDALPADEFWLFNLVSMLEHDPSAAGAFGRHIPYPDASPFVQRDLQAHFDGLAKYPLYLDRNSDKERFERGEAAWRQVLHFYSDNNSCLRRSVWEEIPYPVIEYGEDQVWADKIIRAGYRKAYAINAVVYHSHDYNESETFERSRIESEFFYQHFGYILLSDHTALHHQLGELNTRDRLFAAQQNIQEDILDLQLRLNEARLQGWLSGHAKACQPAF